MKPDVRYSPIKVLGQGGMGKVILARDDSLERQVAIKSIHPHLLSDPTINKRFISEARATAALSHPNIVSIFDIIDSETPSLVLEYVEGPTLEDLLRNGRPLPNLVVLELIRQICLGLNAAHQQHIVHRDIKPSNIFISLKGTVKIGDFGVAHTLRNTGLTQSGSLLGTPEYVAPECVQSDSVTGKADVFSLGCLGYISVTTISPFKGATSHQTIQKICQFHPEPISKHNAHSFPPLNLLIFQCLEKSLDNRLDALGVLESIHAIGEQLPCVFGSTIIENYLRNPEESFQFETALFYKHFLKAAKVAHLSGQAVKAQRLIHTASQFAGEDQKKTLDGQLSVASGWKKGPFLLIASSFLIMVVCLLLVWFLEYNEASSRSHFPLRA